MACNILGKNKYCVGVDKKGNTKICDELGKCFVAGTLILTKEGYKKIEDIKVGDWVWAYDEKTKQQVLKQVTAVFKRRATSLVILRVNGEVIYTTREHPFYISGTWKKAKNLTTTDSLKAYGNCKKAIQRISYQDTLVDVYNFSVAEVHNYHIGRLGYLVHNASGYDLEELIQRMKDAEMQGKEFLVYFRWHRNKKDPPELPKKPKVGKARGAQNCYRAFMNRYQKSEELKDVMDFIIVPNEHIALGIEDLLVRKFGGPKNIWQNKNFNYSKKRYNEEVNYKQEVDQRMQDAEQWLDANIIDWKIEFDPNNLVNKYPKRDGR